MTNGFRAGEVLMVVRGTEDAEALCLLLVLATVPDAQRVMVLNEGRRTVWCTCFDCMIDRDERPDDGEMLPYSTVYVRTG